MDILNFTFTTEETILETTFLSSFCNSLMITVRLI